MRTRYSLRKEGTVSKIHFNAPRKIVPHHSKISPVIAKFFIIRFLPDVWTNVDVTISGDAKTEGSDFSRVRPHSHEALHPMGRTCEFIEQRLARPEDPDKRNFACHKATYE
jgi:hypothetical protein